MPPPPEDDLRRLPPAEADALIASLGSFLTVAIHSLLFHRRLYPPTSFLLARAYNLAVYQSRHPGVCAWVRDAVAAVAAQIRAGALRSLALVVHRPGDFAVAERWTFDLSSFPLDPLSATHPPPQPAPADALDPDAAAAVNSTDLAEALRAALSRIAHTAETIGPPPEGSIFTLAVELRPEAPAPIQVRRPPASPSPPIASIDNRAPDASTLNFGSLPSPISSRRLLPPSPIRGRSLPPPFLFALSAPGPCFSSAGLNRLARSLFLEAPKLPLTRLAEPPAKLHSRRHRLLCCPRPFRCHRRDESGTGSSRLMHSERRSSSVLIPLVYF